MELALEPGLLSFELLFDFGEEIAVPAMQVFHGFITGVDDFALSVGNTVVQTHDGVRRDMHEIKSRNAGWFRVRALSDPRP